jgi:hypothetical protein
VHQLLRRGLQGGQQLGQAGGGGGLPGRRGGVLLARQLSGSRSRSTGWVPRVARVARRQWRKRLQLQLLLVAGPGLRLVQVQVVVLVVDCCCRGVGGAVGGRRRRRRRRRRACEAVWVEAACAAAACAAAAGAVQRLVGMAVWVAALHCGCGCGVRTALLRRLLLPRRRWGWRVVLRRQLGA